MQRSLIVVIVLIVITLAVFWRTGENDFINYDDSDYVYENSHVKTGLNLDNIRWALTTTHAANWHPITWLSHMADCQIYGLNTKGHHLTSVTLHILNSVLLFLILRRMTGAFWNSVFVSFLFALHPLHVESVAWIAERKDVLSTFFFMLTLMAYNRYVMQPGLRRYLLVFITFAMGLMTKPMLVTLPFVLVLLDYWPLRRNLNNNSVSTSDNTSHKLSSLRLIIEKIPFMVLSIASCIVTLYVQNAGDAVSDLQSVRFILRIENAILAYSWYIEKTIIPLNLTVFYPFTSNMAMWKIIVATLLLGGISLIVYLKKNSSPFLVLGWLWFVCTLVPVIGLVKVGSQAMADRYSYIPIIGLFIMMTWSISQIILHFRCNKIIVTCTAVVVLMILSVLSWQQTCYWKNSITLYEHTLKYTHDNHIAHNNMGAALETEGKLKEATNHYGEAIRIKPYITKYHDNLGFILMRQGKFEESVVQFLETLKREPNNAMAHYNVGLSLAKLTRLDEAENQYNMALKLEPNNDTFHDSLGLVLDQKGKSNEAIRHFKEALLIKPDNANVHYNYGVALANQARLPEAISHFREALRITPNDASVYNIMGAILADQGKLDESVG